MVGDDVDVRAEAQRRLVTAGGASGRPGDLHAPAQTVRIGTDGEQHTVGELPGERDHLRAGGHHLDGHLRGVAEPHEPAGAGGVGQAQLVDGRRVLLVEAELVERDGLAPEVALQDVDVPLQLCDAGRRAAEVGERRVAPADGQHGAALGELLQRGDGRCRHRGCRVIGFVTPVPSPMRVVDIAAAVSAT